MDNRIIKFRAWIDSDKQMYEVLQFSEMFPDEGFYRVFIKKELKEGKPMNYRITGKNALMQFTGLKDSKGVDIYEGDLIQCTNSAKYYREVIFRNGNYWLINPDGVMDWEIQVVFTSHTNAEVIGNIYENPELLTQPAKQNF